MPVFGVLAYSKELKGFKGFERVVSSKSFKVFECWEINKILLIFNELAFAGVVFSSSAFKNFEELITQLLYIHLAKRAKGSCSCGF